MNMEKGGCFGVRIVGEIFGVAMERCGRLGYEE